MLRNARLNPKLSVWAYRFGNFDFNKCPLLPPGTKVTLLANPEIRASWTLQGNQGWYIEPIIKYYKCITCYIRKSAREKITDTVKIIPHDILIPQASLEDHLKRSADDIVHLLQHKQSVFLPFVPQ